MIREGEGSREVCVCVCDETRKVRLRICSLSAHWRRTKHQKKKGYTTAQGRQHCKPQLLARGVSQSLEHASIPGGRCASSLGCGGRGRRRDRRTRSRKSLASPSPFRRALPQSILQIQCEQICKDDTTPGPVSTIAARHRRTFDRLAIVIAYHTSMAAKGLARCDKFFAPDLNCKPFRRHIRP